MSSLNKVFLIGNLGQDPELRHTQDQRAVCNFSMATTEKFTKDGQQQEDVQWHRIVVWGPTGEACDKYLSKGKSVMVEGRLKTRSWDDKDGKKQYTTEVWANNVQFLSPKSESQGQNRQNTQNQMSDYIPF